MARPLKAIIDLKAIRNNYRLANSINRNANTLAVVKANAYGHGLVPVAKVLESLVPAFAVACIEEALELRSAGITKPILLLEGVFSADEVATAAEQGCWLTIENSWQVSVLLQAPSDQPPVKIWLKADTGMHRLGFQADEYSRAFTQLQQSNKVQDEIVLSTHFACADELDKDTTLVQASYFESITEGLPGPRSLTNSAALMAWPQVKCDWNRPGFMLYGVSPFTQHQERADLLEPVMTLASAVISLREIKAGESVGYGAAWKATRKTTIATIAVGYGDGYPRHAANGTPVLINGQRAPLVGRVSMDMITVDVTDLPAVAIQDPVELWGKRLCVNEVAKCSGGSAYELLTRMPGRPLRVYTE